jgi:outer membrane protein assembly factor BamB
MKNFTLKLITISVLGTLLSACNGFFDKDNTPTPTPLASFKTEAKTQLKWISSVDAGIGSDYLKVTPAVGEHAIFTTDKNGTITSTDKTTGSTLWKVSVKASLSAGPALNNDLIFIGGREGRVIALRQIDGKQVWNVPVSSEVLAPPTATNGTVLVKTIDGQLTALATNDGHAVWHFQQTEPALILRGGSAPQITHDDLIAGFANGNLAKLTLHDGSLLWQETIAIPEGSFAIQRMVDIDADPVVYNNRVYVATYQGRISALELSSGKTLWTHDISSFTGLAVDGQRVYVSDATSHLWAFDADTGTVDWRQTQLEARNITGPATINNYIVVADEEGYLHWLSKQDGHFVARNRVNRAGILATPVVNTETVYALTKDGHLAAYTLG